MSLLADSAHASFPLRGYTRVWAPSDFFIGR